MNIFHIGDKVKWKSQSNGSITEKHGIIVAVVKHGRIPRFVAREQFPYHIKMFDGFRIPRWKDIEEVYFVEIQMPHKKARLYMPHPKNLKLQ